MRRRHFSWLCLGAAGKLGCSATGREAEGARQPEAPRTIHVAGDSTAAAFETDDARVGWGAVLGEQLRGIAIDAAARSGRSSKSYVEEGHWAALLERLQPGALVLIEFGHNDEKPDPARSTDAATTFRDFLRRYVGDARARGGVPVLLTPICRRRFEGARVRQTHGDYPEATRSVARETHTPLIDMTEKTTELLERFGPEASAQLFAPDDNTHTNQRGARAIARLVAEGLRELGFALPRAAHEPTLTAFPAPVAKRNGCAVLICPGGGYTHLSLEKEGSEVASWLNGLGVTAFVLSYRLADFGHPAPLQDVQQALRSLRERAREHGFAPDKLGVLGFSAGGHLAACASCLFDQQASRPDFSILLYPVITLKAPFCHTGSRTALLGPEPDAGLVDQLSLETRVHARTPPTFLMHTRDDPSVPVENSLLYEAALKRAGVPSELHVYEHGPHGIGLRSEHEAGRQWPQACAVWLRSLGLV